MSETPLPQSSVLSTTRSLFGRILELGTCQDSPALPCSGTDGQELPTPAEGLSQVAQIRRALFLEWLALSPDRRVADLKMHLTESSTDCSPARPSWDESVLEPMRASCISSEEAEVLRSDLRLLSMLLRTRADLPDQSHSPNHPDWRVWSTILRVQQQSDQGGLTLKAVVLELRVSPRHLGRLFVARTGTSFHHYLKAVRLMKAADLLRELPLSIKEIAGAVGYTSATNFSRDFLVATGASPSSHRDNVSAVLLNPELRNRASSVHLPF